MFSPPGGERCGGGASGRQCQSSSKAEISRLEHAESLKPMLNSTHLEEKHEGGVEGGEGGEETHGGTPDMTWC